MEDCKDCIWYLKFVKKVPAKAILQLMIIFLTSEKTQGEKNKIMIKSKVLESGPKGHKTLTDPPHPYDKEFSSILELDQDIIDLVCLFYRLKK